MRLGVFFFTTALLKQLHKPNIYAAILFTGNVMVVETVV